ncbi:YgjV family protein [Vibrio parahaemolyticus]|uniref:YgjV family protein n=2 Tax=Vibrio TaxID=662 RepID=A0A7Y0SGB7_VIBPH|nr:YgjV family protein [Vibrio parahaemolyticus]EJB8584642.1 YgjV family protein [Vibrio parahaemolyticus]EJG0712738.1 YgjV family protein [Vibrio parahaemolyticus]MDF4557502.1 YgjV family protein [Vibrio parahaemolyticus]MDF5016520.1 YgjV family protein [Vibrio parahaemolyticus]MDF5095374.1 YgjV family protein [Vibrio parahaemolyticus]
MENGLAQGIGGIAFLVGVMAFWQKDDLLFRYQMMAFCFIMGIHFTLMGAAVAAIGVIINGIRSFASIKTQSRKVMWFFIALMWLMTLPNITHFFELLTVIGSSVATWALFSKQGIALRSLILFNSFCWVSHNLWLGSIGGSLVESTFIVTNLLTIYRLFHAQERLSQTQNNQFLASNTESSTD